MFESNVEPCNGDEEEDSEVKVPDVGQGAGVELGAKDEEEESFKEDCKQLHYAGGQAVGLRTGEKENWNWTSQNELTSYCPLRIGSVQCRRQ